MDLQAKEVILVIQVIQAQRVLPTTQEPRVLQDLEDLQVIQAQQVLPTTQELRELLDPLEAGVL
jgi:hypothetical protein